MSVNLFPNRPGQTTGYDAEFSAWTATATGSATSPVATYSATSGPDSTPGVTLSATGTSGGVEAVSSSFSVTGESVLALSVVLKASSTTPDLTPWSVTFKDSSGNTVLTVAAANAAPASTSAVQYNTTVAVPNGAVSAQVTYGYLNWSATGGYSVVMSTPVVAAL
jgi:hypothetical protein